MRWLVIGGSSFSGSHFVEHLEEEGHEVMYTSRRTHPRVGRATGVKFDFNHDAERLSNFLADFSPTHIINFAAQSMVAESWDHPEDWMKTNVVGIAKLIGALRRYDKLERYVHVSTPEVYGSVEPWASDDTTPMHPTTPYAASRMAGDALLHLYRREIPTVVTRSANVYGPGQQPYRLIPRAIIAALGGPKLVLTNRWAKRSFIHVDDVCRATLLAAEKGTPGGCYHISSYELVTIAEVVRAICQRMGVMWTQCVEESSAGMGRDLIYALDSRKIRALGWRDFIDLNEGISDTISWALKHKAELLKMPLTYEHKP